MSDGDGLAAKLRDVDSFNRPTTAKVLVVVAIPVAAGLAATVAGSFQVDYSVRAGVTMLLTALFLSLAFVGIAVLDGAVWEE